MNPALYIVVMWIVYIVYSILFIVILYIYTRVCVCVCTVYG